jgi:DMSO reductase anchor subunit
MWRTSWLSREVIVLPAFMGGVVCWLLALSWGHVGGSLWLGLGTAVVCLVLFLCTAMIYASIKFLQEWASPLTVVNYTLLGLASGFTLATSLAALLWPDAVWSLGVLAFIFTLSGLVTRSLSLMRNARLKPKSTLQTAIGIRHPKIVQRARGFMGGAFNLREFFHGAAPGTLKHVRWAFLVGAFVLPLVWLAWGLVTGHAGLLVLAFVTQYAGLLAERWFFFAQARHPQNLYYQAVS